MPLIGSEGAASSQGFGQFALTAAAGPVYVEDVFSTWLYTGNGTAQTITNGINLSGRGGLVWFKSRSSALNHSLFDTARGTGVSLYTNSSFSQQSDPQGLTGFSPSGFTVGSTNLSNGSGLNIASWTFREQPKFFDVVTYTGDGNSSKTISHNLGSAPGCMFVKAFGSTGNWLVYHRSLGNIGDILLNTTSAARTNVVTWNSFTPTSTQFQTTSAGLLNANGTTYVAYLFAHDAGGFGLSGTDNVISCGSFTTDGAGAFSVNLGYEPQWILIKRTDATGGWQLFDNMRGMPVGSNKALLRPERTDAESSATNPFNINATGFGGTNAALGLNSSYIYIVIRRGPMRTPTTGTSVYTPYEVPASPTTGAITGFVTDAGFIGQRAGADKFLWGARLMGNPTLNSTNTNAESANTNQIWDRMNGWWNTAINNYMTWGFARAPGFMDVVNVVTNGQTAPITSTHNLTVVPEMMIAKKRGPTGGTGDWCVYHKNLNGGVTPQNFRIRLNTVSGAFAASGVWNNTAPTATQFTIGTDSDVNSGTAGDSTIVYLFASCLGVSSVGGYTGTGATQVINCGFTGGARFVLVKTASTDGDWLFWDSARGIVAGDDPYLAMNSTAAEVTNTDWVDTAATGFELSNAGGNLANSNGVSYIFLAIA